MGARVSIGPSLQLPIQFMRQWSNPTLEQTNKQVSAPNFKFLFYFLWIYLSGKDSSRTRAKSLILHTSVLCTPFSHMNVNGNGSQSKYLDNGLSRLEFIEYATLLLTLSVLGEGVTIFMAPDFSEIFHSHKLTRACLPEMYWILP